MQDIKRDRVERQWIKRKYQDMFRDLSHCSTFPPSHRRIFNTSTRDLHKGTSTKELQLNTGSTQLLSLTQTPLHKREGTKLSKKKRENKT